MFFYFFIFCLGGWVGFFTEYIARFLITVTIGPPIRTWSPVEVNDERAHHLDGGDLAVVVVVHIGENHVDHVL